MKLKILLIIGIIVNSLIFILSLMPASVSSGQSNIIVNFVFPIILKLNSNANKEVVTFIVRKLAHFSEYAFLSLLFSFYYYFKDKKYYFIMLIHGLLTAIIDEIIQTFVPGRSGEIVDVLIDFSGIVLGVIVVSVIIKLFKLKEK